MHDKPVFEVPEKEVQKTIAVVTGIMTGAPLPVDAKAAGNWEEAY